MQSPIKIYLAPLAGVTDRAFRELAIKFNASGTFSEMISTKGLYYNDKKTAKLLENSEKEHPFFVQIFGHEPEIFKAVSKKALEFGGVGLNINCGCPAKKIISNNDGSALMKNPKLIGELVHALKTSCDVPISVKMRSGWDEDHINAVECAKYAEDNGAGMIIVHGRTTKMQYSGKSDREIIRKVKESVKIPVIANGDIFSPTDAKEVLLETFADGIMLGRGVLGNPYLIKQIYEYINFNNLLPPLNANEKIELAKEHIGLIIKYKGEETGIKEARKHAMWYIKGLKNNVRYKNELVNAKTYNEMCEILDRLK